jgi:hypothetical protein
MLMMFGLMLPTALSEELLLDAESYMEEGYLG